MTSAKSHAGAAYRVILAVAVVAVLAGVFFRILHLDRKTLWGDEIIGLVRMLGYTEAEIVRAGPQVRTAADIQGYFSLSGPHNEGPRPLISTILSLAAEDQHPPLYYLMTRIWVAWAGVTPAALRTLPLIFGILSIGGMAGLAFELFRSARAALIAASLHAISPFSVLYSQEAREYSLWGLETLVSSALLLRAIRTQAIRYWFAYGIIAAVSLYTYPLTMLVLLAHGVFIAATPSLRNRVVLLPFLLAATCSTLLFSPWLAKLLGSDPAAQGMGIILSGKPSALAIALTFARGVNKTWADVGAVPVGVIKLALIIVTIGILIGTLYSLVRFLRMPDRALASRFTLALFAVPALPLLLLHGGALAGQLRYFEPTYLAIPLAVTCWCQAMFEGEHASTPGRFACATMYTALVVISTLSCFVNSQADTWSNKAYERTPKVASIINASERPLVVSDRAVVNDRGTSRVLELAYYLDPHIPMRVNLHCDACAIPAPAPLDVFAEADQFRQVFVLGKLKRSIPEGSYGVRQVGIDMDPSGHGPLEMFAGFPK